MAIKKKPKPNKVIESAPNASLKQKKAGRPSFKKHVHVEWASRKIDIPVEYLEKIALLRIKGTVEGLDHTIFIALKEYFATHLNDL